jgi:hypothetical protein
MYQATHASSVFFVCGRLGFGLGLGLGLEEAGQHCVFVALRILLFCCCCVGEDLVYVKIGAFRGYCPHTCVWYIW